MRKCKLQRNFPAMSGQWKDHKGQTTYMNISICVVFAGSRSFLHSLLSFVLLQVCTRLVFLFHFLPLLAHARSWLLTICYEAWDSALLIQRLLRCLENRDLENSIALNGRPWSFGPAQFSLTMTLKIKNRSNTQPYRSKRSILTKCDAHVDN